MTRNAIGKGDKRDGIAATWAKVKYDRQIVAIAKVHQAVAVYSDDEDVKKHGAIAGMSVVTVSELPLPPEKPQMELPLERPPADADDPEVVAAEIEAQIAEDTPQDFESVAKRLGCDDDKDRFEAKLGKIAKAAPRNAVKHD